MHPIAQTTAVQYPANGQFLSRVARGLPAHARRDAR